MFSFRIFSILTIWVNIFNIWPNINAARILGYVLKDRYIDFQHSDG